MARPSRFQLLSWINTLLETDYAKVEDLCDGIAYMQVIDALHPGKVQLSKLNFAPRFETERARNLRLLDDTLKRLKINKVVQYDRLARGKFADNNDFLSWLYDYAQRVEPNVSDRYEAYEQRVKAQAGHRGGGKGGRGRHAGSARSNNNLEPNRIHGQHLVQEVYPENVFLSPVRQMRGSASASSLSRAGLSAPDAPAAADTELESLVLALRTELTEELRVEREMYAEVQALNQERRHYFDMLRSVELLTAQERFQDDPLVADVVEILQRCPATFAADPDEF